MDFDEYQQRAVLTDQFPDKKSDGALMIPLLGIAGETGTLATKSGPRLLPRACARFQQSSRIGAERPAISVAFLANVAKIAGAGNHERKHLCR